jgi:hypothetical protein
LNYNINYQFSKNNLSIKFENRDKCKRFDIDNKFYNNRSKELNKEFNEVFITYINNNRIINKDITFLEYRHN